MSEETIKIACLSKRVCKACFIRSGGAWNVIEDMYWAGAYRFQNGKFVSVVFCRATIDENSNVPGAYRLIPTDQGIPLDCPYHLEHLLENSK